MVRILVASLVVIAVVTLFGFLGFEGLKSWITDPAAPAWIQAFGSIGAILITGAGYTYAHRQETLRAERNRRQEDQEFLELCINLIAAVDGVLKKINERSDPPRKDWYNTLQAEVETLIQTFGKLDINRASLYFVIEPIVVAETILRGLSIRVREYASVVGHKAPEWTALHDWVKVVRPDISSRLTKLISSLRS